MSLLEDALALTKQIGVVESYIEKNNKILLKLANEVETMKLTYEQINAWEGGELIQNAMPNLSADEREFIKTGVTPSEWAEVFGEEDEDDGQPSWEQEWEDFGEVYSDEY